MGAADTILLALLALADVCLMVHLYRRRQRRNKVERMARALRSAIRREVGVENAPVRSAAGLVLQRAS
jgi:cbb3-type cytochrome oxidase subunit 3